MATENAEAVKKKKRKVLVPLKTREEVQGREDTVDVWVTCVPMKGASGVLSVIRNLIPGDDGLDFQHLRRFAKFGEVPESVREAYWAAKEVATSRNIPLHTIAAEAPTDGETPATPQAIAVTDKETSQEASPALDVFIDGTSTSTAAAETKSLFMIIGSGQVLSHPRAAEALQPILGDQNTTIFSSPVPLLPPTSPEQAFGWTTSLWPTVYKKSNPFGPHPALVAVAQAQLAPEAQNWMALAWQVARQARGDGLGESVGVVVVERDGKGKGRVVAVAGDGRWIGGVGANAGAGDGNVSAHAVLRGIAFVARGVRERRLRGAKARRASGEQEGEAIPKDDLRDVMDANREEVDTAAGNEQVQISDLAQSPSPGSHISTPSDHPSPKAVSKADQTPAHTRAHAAGSHEESLLSPVVSKSAESRRIKGSQDGAPGLTLLGTGSLGEPKPEHVGKSALLATGSCTCPLRGTTPLEPGLSATLKPDQSGGIPGRNPAPAPAVHAVDSHPRDPARGGGETGGIISCSSETTTNNHESSTFSIFHDEPVYELEKHHYSPLGTENGYLCHDLEIYCTHEPCVMCSMAIIHSRFGRVVFETRMTDTGGLCAEGGLELGLHWRKELNWTLLAWQWKEADGKAGSEGESEGNLDSILCDGLDRGSNA